MNVLGRRNSEKIPTKKAKQIKVDSSKFLGERRRIIQDCPSSDGIESKNYNGEDESRNKIQDENKDGKHNSDGNNNGDRNINASSNSSNCSSSGSSGSSSGSSSSSGSGSSSSSSGSSSSSSSIDELRNVPSRIQPYGSFELAERVEDNSTKYSIRHRENVSVFIEMVGQPLPVDSISGNNGTAVRSAVVGRRKQPVCSEKMKSHSMMRKIS